MSKIEEIDIIKLSEAIDTIVNISIRKMLVNKKHSSPTHEWLCFNNLLELIRNRAMDRLEKEEYFK